MQVVGRLREYSALARATQRQTGKTWGQQFAEIRALREAGGQCGISDYYRFRLYDDAFLQGRGRRDFLGWRLQEKFNTALNPRYATLPAWDKLVFTQLASSAGMPVAPILATFTRASRIPVVLGTHLKSTSDVESFLRDPSIYPLFGKPVFSQQGYGSAYLASYEAETDSLVQLNGEKITLTAFLRRLSEPVDHRFHKPESGYLFQRTFNLAPEIFALTQWPALCGVRIICLNAPEGVVPIRAIWKIAVPPNHVDNFSLGAKGNLVADVDLHTGEISRVIDGFWPEAQLQVAHPNSSIPFANFRLPGWDQILAACANGGPAFPLMKIHHWDFALTDQGPLVLELNDIGGTNIPQLHGKGLLTEEVRAFLKRFANLSSDAWVKDL